MSLTTTPYLQLVTSEHQSRPNYQAMLAVFFQASVDQQNLLATFPTLFNVTAAVGDQLDKIGAWVGVSRNLNQSILGTVTLPDAEYRVLIQLFIAMNTWDGTVPGIYQIWSNILAATYGSIFVQDNQDMTMFVVLLTPPSSLLILAILTQGYFLMRPAGVEIDGFFQPSEPWPATPVFGWGAENSSISGWGVGAWVEPIVT